MNKPSLQHVPCTRVLTAKDGAFRLLQLQQRLEAWDRLYNEEIAELRKELSLLAAAFVQDHQARVQATTSVRQPRTGRPSQATEPEP